MSKLVPKIDSLYLPTGEKLEEPIYVKDVPHIWVPLKFTGLSEKGTGMGYLFLISLGCQITLNHPSGNPVKSVIKLYVALVNWGETVTSFLIVELTTSNLLTRNGSCAFNAFNDMTNLVSKKNASNSI